MRVRGMWQGEDVESDASSIQIVERRRLKQGAERYWTAQLDEETQLKAGVHLRGDAAANCAHQSK